MLKLASQFIPVADEVHRLQSGTDPECRLFQKLGDKGHYGRKAAGTTRQGTYAATPSGVLLVSINSNDPARIADLLRRALAKWETLSRKERLLAEAPEGQAAAVKRPERLYPRDGLVLHVFSRDLPRQAPGKGWQGKAWNRDYAWFTSKEARQIVPRQPQVGQKQEVPAALIRRLACVHLVDNVRGQTIPFEERHIKKARLSAEVTAVQDNLVSLRLEGETHTAEGTNRGFEARLLGKATWDMQEERFRTFELLALGPRWGATQFNVRRGDLGPAPMGILFTLAGDSPAERVAPAFHYHRAYRSVLSDKN
ncbi:MAG: hypothetical protein L0Z62_41445 [Gemmataceae bacterium]|nr:hypothetical protein [Gemmataceae bacterium]